MINVFAVFTGKLLQKGKIAVFIKRVIYRLKRTFSTILLWHCNFNPFLNLVMINVLAFFFTGKLLQTLQNSSFHKMCYLEAKTNFLHIFAMAL